LISLSCNVVTAGNANGRRKRKGIVGSIEHSVNEVTSTLHVLRRSIDGKFSLTGRMWAGYCLSYKLLVETCGFSVGFAQKAEKSIKKHEDPQGSAKRDLKLDGAAFL
jgi:hypothetical protein